MNGNAAGTEAMVLWLRAFVALIEDQGLTSQHPHGSSEPSITALSEDSLLHQAHTWYTYIHASETSMHINKSKKKKLNKKNTAVIDTNICMSLVEQIHVVSSELVKPFITWISSRGLHLRQIDCFISFSPTLTNRKNSHCCLCNFRGLNVHRFESLVSCI